MVKQFDAGYFCFSCNKKFIGKRDVRCQSSVKCKYCHKPNNVVRFNHPCVKIVMNKNDK